jgi:hypothetical protein
MLQYCVAVFCVIMLYVFVFHVIGSRNGSPNQHSHLISTVKLFNRDTLGKVSGLVDV